MNVISYSRFMVTFIAMIGGEGLLHGNALFKLQGVPSQGLARRGSNAPENVLRLALLAMLHDSSQTGVRASRRAHAAAIGRVGVRFLRVCGCTRAVR